MEQTSHRKDKLLLFTDALLAKRRKVRGLKRTRSPSLC